jgi:hypothetical protein
VGGAEAEGTAKKTGGARGSKRQRVQQQEPDPMDEDLGEYHVAVQRNLGKGYWARLVELWHEAYYWVW